MSNALNSIPVAPGGGAAAGGMETLGGQSAQAGRSRGRISAESFKQLTAKLKRVSLEAIPDIGGDVAAMATEPALVPAGLPDQLDADTAKLSVMEVPAAQEVPEAASAAQATLPESDADLLNGTGLEQPAPAFHGPPQLELPEFRPISWFDALPEPDAEVTGVADASAMDKPAVETLAGPASDVTKGIEPPVDLAPGGVDDFESPVDLAPGVVDDFESLVDLAPDVADDIEPPIDLALGVVDDTGALVDPAPSSEDIAAESFEAHIETLAENESPAETVSPADAATDEAEGPQVIDKAAHEPPADSRPPMEPAVELAAPPTPEIEDETAAAEDDGPAAELRAEAVEEIHEVFASTERIPASPLAERVVDAMLKTISQAIYAKPSASERASFLREMATFKEEEGQETETPAPLVAQPQPAGPTIALPPILPAPTPEPPRPVEADRPIADALASRMGPVASLLRTNPEDEDDPFAKPAKLALLDEPKPAETADADEASGELALTLLDMMSGGSGTALPHERALASDTLLRILPRIPVKQLQAVVERVAIMETPPALLVAKLIRDPRPEVLGPLLERCSHISDQDLMNAAPSGDPAKLRMMARRRTLSTVLSDYLINIGEPNVLLTLIRNPGAAFSHEAFYRLAEHASNHHTLLPPLATRADLPAPVAFELFWHVPQELRRFILSRFLTDSETLSKILRITMSTHSGETDQPAGDTKFPPKLLIDQALESAIGFQLENAAHQLSEIGAIGKDTALRILSDREGEPIAVLLKAMGYPRAKLEETLASLRHPDAGLLRIDRNPEELPAIFDGLSFNKARILLTYWDWFVRKAGPYAPHN